jgi:hypothetical protein
MCTEQVNWAVETLTESRQWSEQAKVAVEVDFYITRSDSKPPSGTTTPALDYVASLDASSNGESPSIDEKKSKSSLFSNDICAGGPTSRYYGRPNIQSEVSKAIEASHGRTLVVGASSVSFLPFLLHFNHVTDRSSPSTRAKSVCGPTSIAREVVKATSVFPRSQVVAEIATFEC